MSLFHLQIVTPGGQPFDGQAERIIVRTTNGDVAIQARHANYVAALGMGKAILVTETERKIASCIGGMIAVTNGDVSIIANAFEWADQIDTDRAQSALQRAEEKLSGTLSDDERRMAEQARKRAMTRLAVAKEA